MKIPLTNPAHTTASAPGKAETIKPNARARDEVASEGLLPANAARRVLISLMFPSILMPLSSSMLRVALPLIRDDFQISA
ncbi:MAG: hypothetical protein HC802_09330, partial [Caldilineaceae bacterium]|nr:hypothetical protein [Caldilineaceae bacterium]